MTIDSIPSHAKPNARTDVKKATLQNPVHKDTTRVTEVADGLAAEVQRLTLALAAAQQRQ